MTPERWQQLKQLLAPALDLDPSERPAYLEEVCLGDAALRDDLERLLAAEDNAGTAFLSDPPPFAAPGGDLPLSVMSLIGLRFGSYEIVEEIGSGGMGEVYRAVRADDQYRKQVAIKLVRAGHDSKAVIRRFKNERQILASLDHPNIARLLDGGTTEEGVPYFVMELIEGLPVDEYCDQQRLIINERLNLFLQVCSAVHYAHQHLIIHRDVKPTNILVTTVGVPKLLDFGIAKILDPATDDRQPQPTLTIFRAMTPGYASPEQVTGATITTASDLYSLGVVLYELLTGCSPYRLTGRKPQEIARAVCEIEPERPSTVVRRIQPKEGGNGSPATLAEVAAHRQTTPDKLSKRLSGDLDTIVLMALRKEPQRRYASVEQFSQDIQRHLGNLPVAARRDTARYRTSKFVARHKAAVAAAAAIFVILLVGMGVTLREARIARTERARAERRFNDVRKLANSMIFDLPQPIHSLPGAIAVEKMLYDSGLLYLDSLASEAEGDVSLQRELASAYKQMGDSLGTPYGANLGELTGAMANYRKALKLREKVARSNPQNIQDQVDLAKSYRTVGSLLHNTGDLAGAGEGVHKALEIMRPIAQAHDDSVAALRELSTDFLTVGDVEGERGVAGQPAVALTYHLEAAKVILKLAQREPEVGIWQQGVAYIYGLISSDYLALGNPTEATQYAHEGLQILSRLSVGEPQTAAVITNQNAALHSKLGDALFFRGRENEALSEYQNELSFFKKLFDAQDSVSRYNLADGYINVGRAKASSRDATSGFQLIKKGLELLGPGSTSAGKDTAALVVQGYVYEGEVLEQLGSLSGALHSYEKALASLQSRVLSAFPHTSLVSAAVIAKVARIRARLGMRDQARSDYEKALTLAEPAALSKPPNVSAQYVLIDVYAGMAALSPLAGTITADMADSRSEACQWLQKSKDIWRQLPFRNSISPTGFKVTDFNTISTELVKCEQTHRPR